MNIKTIEALPFRKSPIASCNSLIIQKNKVPWMEKNAALLGVADPSGW
jgi:hypothetical protein